ncbi:CaiB/BaiF CoA transferase family protein [Halostagnicola kamekurae]|uniref:Crotonobetainyl-CoA:carnitine CoA-transferase CaiB n=1 Tax=Halostagnicola kamekurae TaxID=619731 RepID=A0A1I6TD52_9EURY|nr:CaiB/BaiF CoA-transferase family protein [Halostagnicola kamekurae]SFS87110.1 Crotonobetainyl-CoA:carnitine CoA-transferase CaiB [Halostagnicola kamekurae]
MRLDSIRILDLTRLLPGPYATQLFADVGADVIKVEDTDAGDYARHMPPTTDRDTGALFDSVNRGKRSVALDLKSEGGREAFYDLVADADVVFEQFRPGVAERLEIEYETLREYNDELVYCSLSGYGGTGPYARRAGHDLNYVGVAGLLEMTRADESMAPQIPGYQIADLGGGLFAAFSIVGGLLSRELGEGGEYVDVSMTDVVASFSQTVAHEALTGDDPRPGETALTGQYPWYDVYEASDGRYVTLAALEPKFWEAFCEEVRREELIDAHGTDDAAELEAVREEVESLFAGRTRDAWLEALSDETMTGPVCTPAEALEHPQLEARGIVERPDDAPPRVGFPAVGSATPESLDESVPDHGEHTDELLASVGYGEDERAALRDRGAIR